LKIQIPLKKRKPEKKKKMIRSTHLRLHLAWGSPPLLLEIFNPLLPLPVFQNLLTTPNQFLRTTRKP
jgi:hypothetical protein